MWSLYLSFAMHMQARFKIRIALIAQQSRSHDGSLTSTPSGCGAHRVGRCWGLVIICPVKIRHFVLFFRGVKTATTGPAEGFHADPFCGLHIKRFVVHVAKHWYCDGPPARDSGPTICLEREPHRHDCRLTAKFEQPIQFVPCHQICPEPCERHHYWCQYDDDDA